MKEKMIKNVEIVSLSSGILGEQFVQHEVELGLHRLQEYGLHVTFGQHARDGVESVKNNPENRAEDLICAFQKSDVDMILCAIGGDDTYRLLPYLFENRELPNAVRRKIFLGFSDTTMNHFMLHKLGIPTFYGQAFLPDVCELSDRMLPYTEKYFRELITTGSISEITPSDVWYEAREDFSPSAVGTDLPGHRNEGFVLLQGNQVFEGKILGGCIDTIYDMFNNERYEDSVSVCRRYGLFPETFDWKGRILLLETSEEKASPEKYRAALTELKHAGVFEQIAGILLGKPVDETYAEEYHEAIVEIVDRKDLPIVGNLNVGHALPRCIVPFGVRAVVDVSRQRIRFIYE